jgi:translocation and assembly module TamA
VKASNYILLMSFWLLNFPINGEAQRPFLFESLSSDSVPVSPLTLSSSISDSVVVQQSVTEITEYLSSIGYFESSIDSIHQNSNSTQIYFSIGSRSRVSIIVDQSGYSHCSHLVQSYYTLSSINECLSQEIKFAESNGFPFTRIIISKIQLDSQKDVIVELDWNRGDKVEINSLEFLGTNNLPLDILIRKSGWIHPITFSPDRINEMGTNLSRSEFIRSVSYLGLQQVSTIYQAVYKIEEIRTSTVDLMLGLEPRQQRGYQIVGQGKLRLNHIFAPASRIDMDFHRSGTSDSRLGIRYDQFSLAKSPIGLSAGLSFNQVDTTYLKVRLFAETIYSYNPNSNILFGIEQHNLSGSGSKTELNHIGHRKIQATIGFGFNSTNSWLNPTKGMNISAKFATGYVNLKGASTPEMPGDAYRVNSISISTRGFIPISGQLVLVPSQQLFHTFQDVYFDSDLVRFGGTNSMRGFREEQFRLAGYSFASIEPRWILDSSSYLFSFMNGAYVWTANQFGTVSYSFTYSWLFSGGFGISYRVRPGLLTVSYAISSDDSWLNGKIHFRIVNSF